MNAKIVTVLYHIINEKSYVYHTRDKDRDRKFCTFYFVFYYYYISCIFVGKTSNIE